MIDDATQSPTEEFSSFMLGLPAWSCTTVVINDVQLSTMLKMSGMIKTDLKIFRSPDCKGSEVDHRAKEQEAECKSEGDLQPGGRVFGSLLAWAWSRREPQLSFQVPKVGKKVSPGVGFQELFRVIQGVEFTPSLPNTGQNRFALVSDAGDDPLVPLKKVAVLFFGNVKTFGHGSPGVGLVLNTTAGD